MPPHSARLLTLCLLTSFLGMTESYNCYRDSKKTAKPLNLAEYTSVTEKHHVRSKRQAVVQQRVAEFDTGNYFSMKQVPEQILKDEFTISMWMYLEGGQPDQGSILTLTNRCFDYSPWSLVFRAATEKSKLSSLGFTLEDVYKQAKSVSIPAPKQSRWFHMGITNSISQLRIYINGVGQSTGEGMTWKDFTEVQCLKLQLGDSQKGFRGKVRDFRIAYSAYTSRMIKQVESGIYLTTSLWLYELFDNLDLWESSSPPTTKSVIIEKQAEQMIRAPSCGKTVCDDPTVISHYSTNTRMTYKKDVHLEIIYLADNDGSHPSVTSEQLRSKVGFITQAFLQANISWVIEEKVIKNTTLNSAFIMIDCRPEMIGDGRCDMGQNGDNSCNYPETNHDGGDCLQTSYSCTYAMLGDGRCDSECNTGYFQYDSGDCCLPNNGPCIDPHSLYRQYFHLSEIKDSLMVSSNKISVVLVHWIDESMLGIAAMPWERNSDTLFGAAIVSASDITKSDTTDTIVHELGHVLGLWHVHHGISEMACTDTCVEREASLELGDLCSDTRPTARHKTCADPVDQSTCSIVEALVNTPYNNFMSYATGSCIDSKVFTRQQAARMHCYLDLVHHNSVVDKRPSPIPLPLQVTYADADSVSFAWLPPLSANLPSNICSFCSTDGTLTQYASQATMTGSDRLTVGFDKLSGPQQATGPPDAPKCESSPESWTPTQYYSKLYKCSNLCQFNFTFDLAIIPESLRVWIAWFSSPDGDSPIHSIWLITGAGQIAKELSNIHIQCDQPYSKSLDIGLRIKTVVINTRSPDVSFDAVELKSAEQVQVCEKCEVLKYKLSRKPPFPTGDQIITSTVFQDDHVQLQQSYEYSVTPIHGSIVGQPADPLKYIHSTSYCSNRQLDYGEDCDDGNLIAGDGCSPKCKVEQGYKCDGTPSVCHMIDNKMEKRCSLRFTHDEKGCGYFVPINYSDQWASSVSPIGKHLQCSPTHLLLGPPHVGQQCVAKSSELISPTWMPCELMYATTEGDNYLLKFGFDVPVVATAVIIHLAVDGSADMTVQSNSITVSLIYEDGGEQSILGVIREVSCWKNPLTLSVYQDLAQRFRRTKEVLLRISSRSISVAAVRLRTYENFDPVSINSCSSRIYSTGTKQCVTNMQEATLCQPLAIENGNLTCSGNSNGDRCSAICDHGYQPNMVSGETVCANGVWTQQLECVMIKCDRPVVPMGYAVCSQGHHFGSMCEVACNSPSRLIGNGTIIKCVETGVWTQSRAYCSILCPDLTTQNAEITENSCSGPQAPGSRCRIKCLDGYHVKTFDAKTKRAKPVCMSNGEWDSECVRVTCDSVPAAWAGIYNCTDGENSGSVCSAVCPTTKVRSTIVCSALGQWEGNFESCSMQSVTCPEIRRPDLILECQGNYSGAKCRVSCKDDNLIVHEESLDGNQVKVTMFRKKLQCSSLGSWIPNVENLVCTNSCNEDYVGDGWCDAVNNRGMCRWDGGDCCKSTSKTRLVQPFPETCAMDCSCKDPGAIENRSDILAKKLWRAGGYAIDMRP